MDNSSSAKSNPDDEPVTVLRRSARLATKEKYHNDSSSEDTGDQVKYNNNYYSREKLTLLY